MASYERFALDEVRRRRPGPITDALLVLAARNNMFAVELLQRRTGVALIPSGPIVHAVFCDRGAEWRGATLEMPHQLPDTLLASIEGRRVDEVVDVEVGGHLIVREARTGAGATRMICADRLAPPPKTNAWSLTGARLLIAWCVSVAYLAITLPNIGRTLSEPSPHTATILGMLTMAAIIGAVMIMSVNSDIEKAACAVFTLTSLGLAALWPPIGWRSDLARRLSGRGL